METHLPNKFFHAIRKSNVTALWDEITWLAADDLVHSIYMLLWSFWKAWAKSVVKVFLYNCFTWLRSQTAGILLWK